MKIALFLAQCMPLHFRIQLLQKSGAVIGEYSSITRGFYIDRPSGLKIGKNVFVNYGCHFHCGADKKHGITVGDNVFIGPDVSFVVASHEIGSSTQRAGKNTYKSIRVNNGVWIGASSTIISGVEIGEGSVVAAGATVVCNIPANELWGGVPAKFIRKLD